ncbi:hypothetical protein OCU04_009047 [Sclerotinia nivalis]|uniref:Uncharacterized protein n=1 Tax=Sclerotinia nivalis TaxID=352851 RepID=A0A9X0AGQ3_9HELO|nr:hypothetical protein OCU04_009047 [Sclerotinia nivalis]
MQDPEENSSEEEEEVPRRNPRGNQPVRGPAPGPAPRPAPEPSFLYHNGELCLQESLKVALPDKYHGNRKELETFLLQLRMYYRFNLDKFGTTDAMNL